MSILERKQSCSECKNLVICKYAEGMIELQKDMEGLVEKHQSLADGVLSASIVCKSYVNMGNPTIR